MAETIKLDPSAVATSRTEVDISAFISDEGVDWGDAAIEAYMAQGERGSMPVDYSIPNRIVTIPLKLTSRSGVSFDTIRRNLQAKVGLFQREGGWMSRQTSVGTLYGDIVNATLRLGGDWLQAHKSIDVNAILTLELIPDWYGSEVTLDDKTETSALALTTVLKLSTSDAVIAGDYPARCRIVVDEDDAETQLGLIWGLRSRYYDSANTAALVYEAEALTPLGAGASTAVGTASGGNAVRYTDVSTQWTPVLSTQHATHGHLTHRGTYNVWVRARHASSAQRDTTWLRFVWDVGDLVVPVENTPVALNEDAQFGVYNLGEIRLDPAPVGTHRWAGIIQAKGEHGDEDVDIDAVMFQPVDEFSGKLVAPPTFEPGMTAYSVRDEFNQSSGALSGKTLPVGGTWAGAGDADDATVNSTDAVAQRTAVSDVSGTGRWLLAGATAYSSIAVQVDHKASTSDAAEQAVFARYVDTSNQFRASLSTFGGNRVIDVAIYVAGSVVNALTQAVVPWVEDVWYTTRIAIDTAGRWFVWYGRQGSALELILAGINTTYLATSGTLDDGRVGIYDHQTSATANTRQYDNFAAWVPNIDAVVNSGQSAQLTTSGMWREDSTGTAYGPVSSVIGSLPRIPPSGLESRKVELFLKASRGDFDQVLDSGIDDISAQVFYRPSWLIAPGS